MPEKQVLAKVTGEISGARGPDVRSKVTVPARWLLSGAQIGVTRPRLAACEHCRGGGCASCEYQGAFALGTPGETPHWIQLPSHQGPAMVTVRLPNLGMKRQNDPVAGHWLLEVHPGAECSPGVIGPEPGDAPRWLWKLVWMVVALVLFWGWLSWT